MATPGFFQLPAEIRGRIYTLALSPTLVEYIRTKAQDGLSLKASKPEQACVYQYLNGLPALLLVCRSVRAETLSFSTHWVILYVNESTLRSLQHQLLLHEGSRANAEVDKQLGHSTVLWEQPTIADKPIVLQDFTMLRIPGWYLQGFVRRYAANLNQHLLLLEVILQRSPEQGLISPESVAMDFEFWMHPEVTKLMLRPEAVIVFEYECVRDLQFHDTLKAGKGMRAVMQFDWEKMRSGDDAFEMQKVLIQQERQTGGYD